MVALVVPKLDGSIRVKARMTHTQTYISAISYSKPMPTDMAKHQREIVENEAVEVNILFYLIIPFLKNQKLQEHF